MYNFKYNYNINLLCLDKSPLNNNSWLSGYIDADGSFYLNWLYDKKGSYKFTILYESFTKANITIDLV